MKPTETEKTAYRLLGWHFLICVGLLLGTVLSLGSMAGPDVPELFGMMIFGALGALCPFTAKLCRKHAILKYTGIFPLAGAVLLFAFGNWFHGALSFVNLLIQRWNVLRADGLRLFTENASGNDQLAFLFALLLVLGMLVWQLTEYGYRIGAGIYVLAWTIVMVLLEAVSVWAVIFLFSAFFCKCLTCKGQVPTKRNSIWCALTFGFLVVGGLLLTDAHNLAIDDLREDTRQQIRKLRYGEQTLPEGDLYQAIHLQERGETMLTVHTEQQKTLYLKGYSGGMYEEETGRWKPTENAAYGGEYSGMLKWLKSRKFDPLMQSATYYTLGDTAEKPQENALQIDVAYASREYGYAPTSVESVVRNRLSEKKDQRLAGKGLFGSSSYTVNELSGSRPAELMALQEWISEPQTEEQLSYLESEAVYRKFVYETYTQPDTAIEELLNRLFWDDYEAENEGIYSALSHVRDVLKNTVQYTTTPEAVPEGETPLYWGLFEAHEGNAMLFATAAVEALRIYGIPARYAEGYYLSESRTKDSPDGTVELTGRDAHAWVEIYFDGIGWQPVDVTPGYYYDTMTLRQMVSLPDTVHKTAAMDDKGKDASGADTKETMDASLMEDAMYHGRSIALVVLGVIALLVILVTALVTLLELARMVCVTWEQYIYSCYSNRQRVFLLRYCIHRLLVLHGLETELGWKSTMVDSQAANAIHGVNPGEGVRITHLFEKQMYGNMELENYEVRTIHSFLDKIAGDHEGYTWKKRLRLHYISLYLVPEFNKINKMSKSARKCCPENGH